MKYTILLMLLLGMTGCVSIQKKSDIEKVKVHEPKVIYKTCNLTTIKRVQYPIIKGNTNKNILLLVMDYEKEMRRLDYDIEVYNSNLLKCKKGN